MLIEHTFTKVILEGTVLWTSSESPLITGGALLGAILLGLGMIYYGYDVWKTSQLIKNTPTEKVRSMAAGRTELEGTVREDDQTVSSPPFIDDDCVYVDAELEVREEHEDEDGETEYRWETVGRKERAYKFYLEDDTGQVLVRADTDPTVEITDDDHRVKNEYHNGNAVPTEIEQFLGIDSGIEDADGAVGTVGTVVDAVTDVRQGSKQHQYTQTALPVGSDVYAFGSAEVKANTDGSSKQEDRLEIRRDDGSDTFIISDGDEGAVIKNELKKSLIAIAFGFLFSIAGLYMLLTWSAFPI